MEAAEVDEGVGAQEEIGDDWGDGVELRFSDPGIKGQPIRQPHQGTAWHCPSLGGDPKRATRAQ